MNKVAKSLLLALCIFTNLLSKILPVKLFEIEFVHRKHLFQNERENGKRCLSFKNITCLCFYLKLKNAA